MTSAVSLRHDETFEHHERGSMARGQGGLLPLPVRVFHSRLRAYPAAIHSCTMRQPAVLESAARLHIIRRLSVAKIKRETTLRYLTVDFIKNLVKKGKVFELALLYSLAQAFFPRLGEVAEWKKAIRFGLQDAKDAGLIQHMGSRKSGQWMRI